MANKNNTELSVKQLRHSCDPKEFKFTSTKKLPALEKIIGQNRALDALSFGLDIKNHGYHIYALGPVGTGKTTTIRKFLEKTAKDKTVPSDWLYVNNFEDHDKPHALRLPVGKGREFRDDMEQMVVELKTEVPKAFEAKEYTQEQERIEQEFQRRSKELFLELDKKAEESSFRLMQTPQGMAALPIIGDKVLTPDVEIEIDDEKQKEIEENQEKLQSEMRETMRQVEQLQKEGKDRIRDLDQRVISFAVDHLINDLKNEYKEFKHVVDFLSEARAFLLKNVQTFKELKQIEQVPQQAKMSALLGGGQEPSFEEYRVNLIVDNGKTKGAPVIIEKNPTGPNLIGRTEQQGWFGTLVTNFSMIKRGSLHKANGGYLIINALDLLKKPFAWQILKRALKNEEIMVESMSEAFGAFMTRTLEPEPIPLQIKVILIGDPYLYYLLYNLDPEFTELFKVKADFEVEMKRGKEAINQYAQFIGTVCNEEELKHFVPEAVARVVEHGSRMIGHQQKMATKFGDIVDLIRESNYWASKNGNKLVQGEDVQKALEEKIYRSSRIEEQIREMIEEGTILIDTDKNVEGQVNGLSVLSLGDYSFGKPSRITVRTYAGTKGVISIDREVELGGPIHNKATMILTGYFGGKYAADVPTAFSASISFEQLYEEVEGDSATAAEIYALLSSLSGYPLRQDLAVTGSANQHGEIQAIGGANEKIEGFFKVCKIKGLTGKQGVIIPKSNINHLMLHDDVINAVKKGKFHIYAVSSIDEGIALLTGKTSTTVDKAVQKRLKELAKKAKEFGKTKKSKKRKTKSKSKSKKKTK
jgi:lon-related putative ATP-dependent protease